MDLEKIKKKRTSVWGSTTKQISKIESILKNNDMEISLKIEEIKDCQKQINEKFSELKELDKESFELTDVKEVENEVSCCEEYIETIVKYRGTIKENEIKSKDTASKDKPVIYNNRVDRKV